MQHLTTLLAGKMKGFDEHEMAQLINLVERVFFWYQIVAERGGSALYQRYAHWAVHFSEPSPPKKGLLKWRRKSQTSLPSMASTMRCRKHSFG